MAAAWRCPPRRCRWFPCGPGARTRPPGRSPGRPSAGVLGGRRLGSRSTGGRPVDSGSAGDEPRVKQAIGGSAQAAPDCCKRLPLTGRRSRLASSRCACRCHPSRSPRRCRQSGRCRQTGHGRMPEEAGRGRIAGSEGVAIRAATDTPSCSHSRRLAASRLLRDRGEQRARFRRSGRAGRRASTGTAPAGEAVRACHPAPAGRQDDPQKTERCPLKFARAGRGLPSSADGVKPGFWF